jgi:hypothetical protein
MNPLLLAHLASSPASAACDDPAPRELGEWDGIAFRFRRAEPLMGVYPVHWGVYNRTSHEVEVWFEKSYSAGDRPVATTMGSVRLDPGEAIEGGTVQGDLATWDSFWAPNGGLREGECITKVSVRPTRIVDHTAEAEQREAARAAAAEEARRAEAQRQAAAEAAERAREAAQARADAAAARQAAERDEYARRADAIAATQARQQAAAEATGAAIQELGNTIGGFIAEQARQREEEERRAEERELRREQQEAEAEERRQRAAAEAEREFWAQPADVPSVEGRVAAFEAVGWGGSAKWPFLAPYELAPDTTNVGVDFTLRHPRLASSSSVRVRCEYEDGAGMPLGAIEWDLVVAAGRGSTQDKRGWAGPAGGWAGRTGAIRCTAEGRELLRTRYAVVDGTTLLQRKRRADAAAAAEAKAEAEARARTIREAWLPALGSIDTDEMGGLATYATSDGGTGYLVGWYAQTDMLDFSYVMGYRPEFQMMVPANVYGGINLARWPSDVYTVPFRLVGLSAGAELGGGVCFEDDDIFGGHVGAYVTNTSKITEYVSLRTEYHHPLFATEPYTPEWRFGLGVNFNEW